MTHPDPPQRKQKTPIPVSVVVVDPSTPGALPSDEIGGRDSGLDPTRYGDWEKNGRCIDF